MALTLERNVLKFYQGLEQGIIYGRKCTECGAVEFPRITRATSAAITRRSGLSSPARACSRA